ncbi:alpha/beta hydrolase [Candidatus Kaiserbacteria bacterium]|nr:alpha/beta hydrolase [Candidatus Kaiserbacteria bacterium]
MEQFILTVKAQQQKYANPLVLIHGSWGSSAMWMGYTQFLSMKGFDVYAPDLRGHGKSEGALAGATMSDYVADVVRAVADHGLKDPVVVGHSMGGLIALMYAAEYGAKAVIAIDPSPSKEVQGEGVHKDYLAIYSPMDAGMPADPMEVMKALPDIPQEMLMKMKDMLGMESGVARSERKLGISIPKEKLPMPILFVGGELGESVPFGIGIKTARAMADFYGKEVLEIKGATHPGILIGEHAMEAVQGIEQWIAKTSEGSNRVFTCPVCGMQYKDEEIAKRCEAWCTEHHSCNLDIISHAVKHSSIA